MNPLPACPFLQFPCPGEHRIPAEELQALLRLVDLEYLLDRSGGGGKGSAGEEEVTDWGEVLSLGELLRDCLYQLHDWN